MKTIRTIPELREALHDHGDVGLVPTMGAFHDGHLSLIRAARAESELVVVSLFVNPTQFAESADLDRYPRDEERDADVAEAEGVDVLFAPSVQELYPPGLQTWVEVEELSRGLEGAFRPGHFRGVATVVMKLFGIVQPDRAYFGEKDAQQLAIIRRLVADLNVPVQIVGVPTVREPDGLALSSRNAQLGPAERQSAIALFRALQTADRQIAGGDTDAEHVKRVAAAEIPHDNPSLRLEYLEIVDPENLQPVTVITGPVRVAGALWVGSTRLIDNVLSVQKA